MVAARTLQCQHGAPLTISAHLSLLWGNIIRLAESRILRLDSLLMHPDPWWPNLCICRSMYFLEDIFKIWGQMHSTLRAACSTWWRAKTARPCVCYDMGEILTLNRQYSLALLWHQPQNIVLLYSLWKLTFCSSLDGLRYCPLSIYCDRITRVESIAWIICEEPRWQDCILVWIECPGHHIWCCCWQVCYLAETHHTYIDEY